MVQAVHGDCAVEQVKSWQHGLHPVRVLVIGHAHRTLRESATLPSAKTLNATPMALEPVTMPGDTEGLQEHRPRDVVINVGKKAYEFIPGVPRIRLGEETQQPDA